MTLPIFTNETILLPTVFKLNETKEILNWHADLNPQQPELNFKNIRKTPTEYVEAEIQWYESASLDVSDIETYAKIWSQIKSIDNKVNSNYGWCIRSEANGAQYTNVIEELRTNKESRRGSMIYTRPNMHEAATHRGMNDFICTWGAQVRIKDDYLYYTVHQRSCDFVYGFFNDFAWHCHVYEQLFNDLSQTYKQLQRHYIHYFCDSLHIYPRHYSMIQKIVEAYREEGVCH